MNFARAAYQAGANFQHGVQAPVFLLHLIVGNSSPDLDSASVGSRTKRLVAVLFIRTVKEVPKSLFKMCKFFQMLSNG